MPIVARSHLSALFITVRKYTQETSTTSCVRKCDNCSKAKTETFGVREPSPRNVQNVSTHLTTSCFCHRRPTWPPCRTTNAGPRHPSFQSPPAGASRNLSSALRSFLFPFFLLGHIVVTKDMIRWFRRDG